MCVRVCVCGLVRVRARACARVRVLPVCREFEAHALKFVQELDHSASPLHTQRGILRLLVAARDVALGGPLLRWPIGRRLERLPTKLALPHRRDTHLQLAVGVDHLDEGLKKGSVV